MMQVAKADCLCPLYKESERIQDMFFLLKKIQKVACDYRVRK